jgi:hypothetical protein
MLGATALPGSSEQAAAYDIVNRWGSTQVDGGGLQRGDPVTLRWSVVPDGESYSRSNNSQLVQYLDDGWNIPAAQRTPDFTNRSWWTVMNNAYAQFARVSGIRMEYVAEKFANGLDTGLEGDIRIGGENIDGTPVRSPTIPFQTAATCGSIRPANRTVDRLPGIRRNLPCGI